MRLRFRCIDVAAAATAKSPWLPLNDGFYEDSFVNPILMSA